jgi:hypothetical protein
MVNIFPEAAGESLKSGFYVPAVSNAKVVIAGFAFSNF